MRPTSQARWVLAATVTATLALLAGCGDDDDGNAADTTMTAERVDVTAFNYGYEGLPTTMAAGTTMTLTNTADDEVHELAAIRLPDDEDRAVAELLELPEAELDGVLSEDELATVTVALPAEEGFAAVGDGSLTEPGRYVIACFIPTGADPEVFMRVVEAGGDVESVPGGPPHFVQGMFAEVTVG